jgi:hypothetical protein
MHFCEGKAELFPLGENVFMPGWSLSRWRLLVNNELECMWKKDVSV